MNFRSPKLLLIIGVLCALLIVASVFFLTRRSTAPPPVAEAETSSPTLSPQPSVDPLVADDNEDAGINEFTARYPLISALPHETPFWLLQIDGEIADEKLPLLATVYYNESGDPKERIERQKPYIEQYIASTGQAPGTYTVTYHLQESLEAPN